MIEWELGRTKSENEECNDVFYKSNLISSTLCSMKEKENRRSSGEEKGEQESS